MSADHAREAAYACVAAVQSEDAYANLVMPTILREGRLSGRDAAFATELAYGALRMQGWYDKVIAHAAKRDAATLDDAVRWSLWLGVHQVLNMRVPPHAAVSQTVDQVRGHAGAGAAKFANAVMRRVTERQPEAWEALLAAGSSRTAMAARHSHPSWVADALAAALDADGRATELEALLAANNTPARVALVARPGVATVDELLSAAPSSERSQLSPYGVLLSGGEPGAVPAVKEGRAGVQDEGSQVVAAALVEAHPVTAGEKWLDMCAGPGGKAALLGALAAQQGASVDALELHPHRAELVKQSVRSVPEGVVEVHVGDAREWGEDGQYDRVLLDAPCTGIGSLRRRPESRWRRTPQDLEELGTLQRELLAAAKRLVKPGGIIAYVTCSPVLAETRDVVASVPGLISEDARDAMATVTGKPASEWGTGPAVQMWTHAHGTDAMFVSILRRANSDSDARGQ